MAETMKRFRRARIRTSEFFRGLPFDDRGYTTETTAITAALATLALTIAGIFNDEIIAVAESIVLSVP